MRSLKHLVLASTLVLSFATSTMVAPAAAQDKKLTIAFVNTGSESGWRAAFTDAMKSEATKEGIDLKYTDGQQKQEVQIAGIRAAIAQKVDAIVLAAIVETGWDAVLKEAKDAKIPLLLVDRDVKVSDPSLYPVTRVGADFDHEGRLAASFVAMASAGIPKWANGCNIVELQGTTGASAATERAKGFGEVLALFPGLKIVASQNGDFTREGGQLVGTVCHSIVHSNLDCRKSCSTFLKNLMKSICVEHSLTERSTTFRERCYMVALQTLYVFIVGRNTQGSQPQSILRLAALGITAHNKYIQGL